MIVPVSTVPQFRYREPSKGLRHDDGFREFAGESDQDGAVSLSILLPFPLKLYVAHETIANPHGTSYD